MLTLSLLRQGFGALKWEVNGVGSPRVGPRPRRRHFNKNDYNFIPNSWTYVSRTRPSLFRTYKTRIVYLSAFKFNFKFNLWREISEVVTATHLHPDAQRPLQVCRVCTEEGPFTQKSVWQNQIRSKTASQRNHLSPLPWGRLFKLRKLCFQT